MDLKKIKEFINLAKSEGVSSLKYESDNEKISVSLPYAGSEMISLKNRSSANVSEVLPGIQNTSVAKENEKGFYSIKSPFVGTFYSSPSPSEPAYVNVGDKIHKGKVLCILEAMKIMNEIESDVAGEVVKICVDNESLVEYGQVLFQIKV